MQHFDFLYVTSYNECDTLLVCGLRDACARAGKSFAVLGYTSEYVAALHRRLGVTYLNVRAPGRLPPLSAAGRRELEASLPTTLREFTFPEARYYLATRAKLARRTAAIGAGFARLRTEVSFGCMVHKLGAELIRRCAEQEARRGGVRTLYFGTFPAQFSGRMFLHGTAASERDSAAPPAANTHDPVAFADFQQLLRRIRDRREVVHYPVGGNRRWGEFLRLVSSMCAAGEYEFIDDLVRRRVELLRLRARGLVGEWRAGSTVPDGQFYFFPLHVFDDSQITVRNPEYYDQGWIIEYISRVLPEGMRLAVKLHPGVDGAVPLAFLRRLGRLDNVVLLKGSVNAHEVIKRSSGVVVINSTVALEALLHAKPVLVLGRWSFGRLGMTAHLDDPLALAAALRELRHRTVDSQAVDRMLYDLYGEMYRCSYNRLPIDYDALVRSMLQYLERP
jgi:capsular polysaccharide biosynthesis protein